MACDSCTRSEAESLRTQLAEERRKREGADARASRYREALEDLAEHGVRRDLTPTQCGRAHDELWWFKYLKGADSYVRNRARAALRDEGKREPLRGLPRRPCPQCGTNWATISDDQDALCCYDCGWGLPGPARDEGKGGDDA